MTADTSRYLTRSWFEQALRTTILFGMFWMVVGLIVPGGEHLYEYLLILTLPLPGLILIALRPTSVRVLWRHPSTKWVLLLIAWSFISLFWSETDQARDWVGRGLGILLFLYAWTQALEDREARVYWLLCACGAALMVAAIAAMLAYQSHVLAGGRLWGFGAVHNENLAAQLMSAAVIWLCALPQRGWRWEYWMRSAVVAVLLAFICLTYSRGAWGALVVALFVVVACGQSKWKRWQLGLMVLLCAVATALFLPQLLERGWSYRLGLFQQTWDMFLQDPWFGAGQGTEAHFVVRDLLIYHTHNMFAQLAVQLGLVGLLLFLCLWFYLGWRGWCYRHEPLGRLVLGSWVFATIQGQVALPQIIDSPGTEWLVVWVPLAINYSLKTKNGATADARSKRHEPGHFAAQ